MSLSASYRTAIVLAFLSACSPSAPSNLTCGSETRTGLTDCPTQHVSCQTGTYCNPDSTAFVNCLSGCASDENCASNQHCLKCSSTAAHGTCQDCSVTACTSTCAPAANDPACLSPGVTWSCSNANDRPATSAGSCTQIKIGLYCCGGQVNPCMRNLAQDPLCPSQAYPNAYDCPPNASAPGCTKSIGDPQTYCCP